MDKNEAQEYSESLAQIGQGWYRQIAWAARQGIPEALGLSTRQWGETYHGYLSMAIPERQAAVAELEADGFSKSETADALGVSPAVVARDRRTNKGVSDDTPAHQNGAGQATEAVSDDIAQESRSTEIDGKLKRQAAAEAKRLRASDPDYAVALMHALERLLPATRKARATADNTPKKQGRNPHAAEVREWANAQGLKVPARGRLPKDIEDKYNAAH
jgi:predicted transcriptional regulator